MKRLTVLTLMVALVLSCEKNLPPTASFSVNPTTGTTDTVFSFDASSSLDEETSPGSLLFRWDFESDGTWDTERTGNSVISHTFLHPAAYNVKLEVTDEEGMSDFETLVVWVDPSNSYPQAVFIYKTEDGNNTQLFEFDASGSFDAETKTEDLVVRWDWTSDSIWDTEFSREKVGTHRFPVPGIYEVTMEIRDLGGLTDTARLTIRVLPLRGTFIDARDKHEYSYVVIGSQTWMAENLAFLPRRVDSPTYGSDEKQYYYVYGVTKDTAWARISLYYQIYGVLYNWRAAITACPFGWHLPSDDEWMILEENLGMSSLDLDRVGNRVTGHVGYKLKSTTLWIENGGGDNSSGFNALPAAGRSTAGGFYVDLISAAFWTTTLYNNNKTVITRSMGTQAKNSVYRSRTTNKAEGFSVRCLKSNN